MTKIYLNFLKYIPFKKMYKIIVNERFWVQGLITFAEVLIYLNIHISEKVVANTIWVKNDMKIL